MTEIRTLMTGIALGESPRWHDDRLLFCDWPAQEVIALDLDGHHEVVARVPTWPFCIDLLPDGRLIAVSGRDNRLLVQEPDGSLVTYADLAGPWHPLWNDIVVDGSGHVYVNNTGFEFPGGEFRPGHVALVTPEGARQVADDVAFPNGMAVTADESTLIVAESYAHRLTAFDIAPDGSLSNRRIWADLGEDYPDGICVDAEGAVWYADVPHQHCVRVAEGGEVLQTVEVDRGCFACALGGPDRRTLFIVAAAWTGPQGMADGARTGRVLAVDAPAAGAGHP
jgi:sugar lactone lactonase YvrE